MPFQAVKDGLDGKVPAYHLGRRWPMRDRYYAQWGVIGAGCHDCCARLWADDCASVQESGLSCFVGKRSDQPMEEVSPDRI